MFSSTTWSTKKRSASEVTEEDERSMVTQDCRPFSEVLILSMNSYAWDLSAGSAVPLRAISTACWIWVSIDDKSCCGS